MKATTLWQPFASLVAWGDKTIETRSWAPGPALIGERLAIHAAKRLSRPEEENWHVQHAMDNYCVGARAECLVIDGTTVCSGLCLPYGVVVATARLARVGRVFWRSIRATPYVTVRYSKGDYGQVRVDPFGNYTDGRYLWFLEDIEVVDPPVPTTGRQGMWNWE